MSNFTFDGVNHVDRDICFLDRRVRPVCLDAAFEADPGLVAISCELKLTGDRSDHLLPMMPVKAWHRTQTNRVNRTATSEMSSCLLRAIVELAGRETLSEAPLSEHAEAGVDPEYTSIYEIFFMREVTIIGWAHPEDGMASIEGEDIDEAYPRPAEFLGCVYATSAQSNHLALHLDKRIRQDILDHHRLFKQITAVSCELRNLIPA